MGKNLGLMWSGASVAVVSMLCSASPLAAQDGDPIRVGCLGDSITVGSASGIKGPEAVHFSYPAILDSILGEGYDVRGFGAGGHALRSDARLVYGTCKKAAQAVEFAPDVALIVLGTNDSVLKTEYDRSGEDLDALVERLRSANPDVKVWLSSPPQMFPLKDGLAPARRANLEERQPRLNALAKELKGLAESRDGVKFVDVRDVLRPRDVTDGVHLNPFGAERLAYRYADTILGSPVAPALTPVPAVEYRGQSAGWGGGTWRDAYSSLKALAAEASQGEPVDVLFLGDSITQGLTGHGERWSKASGSRVFDEFHGGRRAVSVGLSGDRTEHILYRIQDGSLDGFRPGRIVLQVGINNVNAAGHSGYWTYHGIVAVVRALEERFPGAHIIVAGPFPGGVEPGSEVRKNIAATHSLLRHAEFGPFVDVLNLTELFVGPGGRLLDTMGNDGIHITPLGQRRWMQALEPYFVAPPVTEGANGLTIVLAEGVVVEVDTLKGLRSLTACGVVVAARDPEGKEWLLDGHPAAMRVKRSFVRGGSVSLAMGFDMDSWEAPASQRNGTVPNDENMAETWRLASLGAARGFDRRLTKRSQGASLGEYWTTTARQASGPLKWSVEAWPVKDFYGYSTVSSSGLTYDIRRIAIDGGAGGWWFRSGVHLMNQAVNMGQNPALREVVLIEPPGSDPLPLEDVIRAYVTVPQDRKRLLAD